MLAAPIEIEDDLLIQRVLVVVSQTAADRVHRLVLTAPDGTKTTLHDVEKVGPARGVIFDSSPVPIDTNGLLDPPEFRGAAPLPTAHDGNLDRQRHKARLRDTLAGYVVRPPRESLDALRNRRSAGTWTLSWTHFREGGIETFEGWSLLLFGPPITRVAGKVVVSGETAPAAFADIKLDVVGLPASWSEQLIAFDRSDGRFEIDYLPRMRLDILASKPGFAQSGISALDSPDHPRGFRDNLEGFLAGERGSDELRIVLRPANTPPIVRSSVDRAVASATGDTVSVKGVRLSVYGRLPMGAPLLWEPYWRDADDLAVSPDAGALRGRSVTVDLQFPVGAFKPENNFTTYVRPRVLIDRTGTGKYAVLPYALTVALADPPGPLSPYQLVQGGPLLGFGGGEAAYAGGADPTGGLGLQAQKTTVAKVDLDRVPKIGPDDNPALKFAEDGVVGEDVDLHPRGFDIRKPDKSGYAYALIVDQADGRFGRLEPASSTSQSLRYRDDVEKGIAGRDINAPGEPVAIHSAIGGQIVNLGVAGTDGEYRISAGATPGVEP